MQVDRISDNTFGVSLSHSASRNIAKLFNLSKQDVLPVKSFLKTMGYKDLKLVHLRRLLMTDADAICFTFKDSQGTPISFLFDKCKINSTPSIDKVKKIFSECVKRAASRLYVKK